MYPFYANKSYTFTILANLAIILSIIYILVSLFWTSICWLKISSIVTLIVGIVIRWILEVNAINGSISLAKQVVTKKIMKEVTNSDIQASIEYINKHKWLALMQMILDKIIFLILTLVIK